MTKIRQSRIRQPLAHKYRETGPWSTGYAILGFFGVAVVVAAVHWPGAGAKAFFTDDPQYLLNNPLVKNPGWRSAERFLTEVDRPSSVEGYYHPLTMLSLMADYAAAGRSLEPARYRATNVVLHGLNAGLVTLLAWLLCRRIGPAVAAGLLFGMHPTTVEAVIWIAERKTLLASLFGLLSLLAYVGHVRRPRRWTLPACLVAFLLALLAKPIVVPLPLFMILLDWWPMRRLHSTRDWSRSVLMKWPLLALSVVFAVITYVSQSRASTAELPTDWTPLRAPLVACYNLAFHVRNFVWPMDLYPFHPYVEPFSLSQPAYLVAVITVGTLALSAWLVHRRIPGWSFALLFFFVAAFPTLGLIGFGRSIVQEKYAYFPSVGAYLAVAALIAWLWERGRARSWRAVIPAACAVLAVAWSAGAWRQQHFWRDDDTLYGHVLQMAPDADLPRLNYGVVLYDRGDYSAAVGQYREVIRLRPRDPDAYNNLGNALWALGQHEEAMDAYAAALERSPGHADAHVGLGYALSQAGKLDEAIEHYRRALAGRPNHVRAWNNLGNALLNRSEVQPAIEALQKALAVDPNSPDTHTNLATALATAGRLDEAVVHYRRALAVNPDLGEAHYNLAHVLARLGRPDEARQHLRNAIEAFDTHGQTDHANLARQQLDALP